LNSEISWYGPAVIRRVRSVAEALSLLRRFPVVALLGSRQVGKTTLATQIAASWDSPHRFDLEDAQDVARLGEPSVALRDLRGLVVLDEIQRRPELFPLLRVLADRPRRPARFLVLGSASPDLLRQSSETLAGRIAYQEISGFDLEEVEATRWKRLWLRGGFPRAFLAKSDADARTWRRSFVRSFLERDLPELGLGPGSVTMRRFWTMLAHGHGQIWNSSALAGAFGVSDKTVRAYLDILCGTFVARRLPPWFENIGKRQVKSPKVYLTDSGILHELLGLGDWRDLLGHPTAGSSWEGFAIQQVISRLGASSDECFFWAVHSAAELDLLVVRGRHRLGFEMKFTDAPRVTSSMRSALETLRLDRLDVIHVGPHTFAMDDRIRAVSISRLCEDVPRLS
jgi:uncharacterized protein